MACEHHNFHAEVAVGRLENDRGLPMQFMADIRVKCAECGLPFEFLGLECGLDLQGARVSLDAQEAHIALIPKGQKPNPLQRMVYNINKFES